MEETITKTQYPESERLKFLPHYAGRKFWQFENRIYNYMSEACPSYHGGYWEFFILSNGGFYMAFEADTQGEAGTLPMHWEMNGYSGHMSADAASIAVNLMAMAHQCELSGEADQERFANAFHALRDYAAGHAEAGEIFRFID